MLMSRERSPWNSISARSRYISARLERALSPNVARDPCWGLPTHFIATSTQQITKDWDSATLVRGGDRYHHFSMTPCSPRDLKAQAVCFHERAAVAFPVFNDAGRVRQSLSSADEFSGHNIHFHFTTSPIHRFS
ncbi:MAG: hypothetical protein O3C28_18580 [Proteobacteria bacterium]|nr:hypothetical protein [Pseudomonadota bacterium]